jgi:hypothetical protein
MNLPPYTILSHQRTLLKSPLFLDATGMDYFTDNSYGQSVVFSQSSMWYNRTTDPAGVGTNALQATVALQPNYKEQDLGGNGCLEFYNSYLTLAKFSKIDLAHNAPFRISISIKTNSTDSATKWILDSRNTATGKQGLGVYINASGNVGVYLVGANGNAIVVYLNTSLNDYAPHTIDIINSGAGNASGFKFYLDGLIYPTTVYSDQAIDTIQSLTNPYIIGCLYNKDLANSYRGMLGSVLVDKKIPSFSDVQAFKNHCIRASYFSGIKSSLNPVINGSTLSNPQSSYPPMVWKEGSTYYAMTDSLATDFPAFISSDGTTFTDSHIALNAGTTGAWDDSYIAGPLIRKVGSTYHMFYSGQNVSSGFFGIGHATNTSPTTAYTKDVSNPIFTAAMYNAVYNRNMDNVILGDVIMMGGGDCYWFVTAFDNARSEIILCHSTSLTSTITPIRILFKSGDVDSTRSILQEPTVHKTSWGWMIAFTIGTNNFPMHQERIIKTAYCLGGSPDTTWVVKNEAVVSVGDPGSWEGERAYGGRMFKTIDDSAWYNLLLDNSQYRFDYSGHSMPGIAAPNFNTGKSGLVRYPSIPDIRNLRDPSFKAFTSIPVIDGISGGQAWVSAQEQTYFNTSMLVWQMNNRFDKNNILGGIMTSSTSPTYVSAAMNGLPVIRFDGVGNYLSFAKAFGNLASYTMFIVLSPLDFTVQRYLFGGADSGPSNASFYAATSIESASPGTVRTLFSDGNATHSTYDTTNAALFVSGTPAILTITYQNGNGFSTIYKNGVSVAVTNGGNNATSTGSTINNFSVGRLGDYDGKYMKGDMAEFGMYNRVLSGTEITNICNYLKTKYNIS